MKRFASYITARNIRIAWIVITLITLAAAAGAPAAFGRG